MFDFRKSVLCVAVFSCMAASTFGQDVFLSYSDFGEGNARSNIELNSPSANSIHSVYIWVDKDFEINTGIFLNVRTCGPSGIRFTGGEVLESNILIGGAPVFRRWTKTTNGNMIISDNCVEHLDAMNGCAPSGLTGKGILTENTGPVFSDELYESAPGTEAFLYARVEFEILDPSIDTELCIEVGCGLIVDQCVEKSPEFGGTVVVGDDMKSADCSFESNNVLCELDEMGQLTGNDVITGSFTNLQDIPGSHLFLPLDATTPVGVEVCFGSGGHVLTLDQLLNNGDSIEIGSSLTNQDAIVVKNAMPGDEVCFRLVLFAEDGQECCSIEVCYTMPPCDCLQVDRRFDRMTDIVCNPDGTINFSYEFRLTNLFGQDIYHAFLAPEGSETFMPDYFDLVNANGNLPLSSGQSVILKTIVKGAIPETSVDFLIAIHLEDLTECCVRPHDVLSPKLKGDLNGDGVLDLLDVAPFVDLLSNGGPYDPYADMNGDGAVNLQDVGPFVDLLTGCLGL